MARKASVNAPPTAGWSESVGAKGKNLVTVYERLDKKRMVYLRWSTAADGLQRESLGKLIPWMEGTAAIAVVQHECRLKAVDKSGVLIGIRNEPREVDIPAAPPIPEPPYRPSAIPLRVGLERAHNALYMGAAREMPHAKEQLVSIDLLCSALQQVLDEQKRLNREDLEDVTWQNIPAAPAVPFTVECARRYNEVVAQHGRAIRGAGGVRQTEKALSFLFQASHYLASQERLLAPVVPPKGWLATVRETWYQNVGNDLLHIPAGSLRYTAEERDALLGALGDPRVDPRVRVAVTLGSGSYRLGQIIRMRRSHVEPRGEKTPYGRMTIASAGKKKGGGYLLTKKECLALEFALSGYLREFVREFPSPLAPYPLFPAGVIRWDGTIESSADAKPLDIKTLNELWHVFEGVAGVARMPGRAWYGLRRANADVVTAAAARVGAARGQALDHMAILLVTNHMFEMQQHYRAESDVTVDEDNYELREELERPQAPFRKKPVAKAPPTEPVNRHPQPTPESSRAGRP